MQEMLSRSSLETQKLELLSMMSELKLQQAALERENLELRSSHFSNNTSEGVKKPALLPRMSPQPQHTSTPVHASQNQVKLQYTFRFFLYDLWCKIGENVTVTKSTCIVVEFAEKVGNVPTGSATTKGLYYFIYFCCSLVL